MITSNSPSYLIKKYLQSIIQEYDRPVVYERYTDKRDSHPYRPDEDAVSRWYSERFKKSLGFPTGEGKDFHSFRHTFGANLAHNEINGHSLKALMGHAEDSITFSTYVKRGAPTKLYKDLADHLDYGLNLDHLMNSRYTCPRT